MGETRKFVHGLGEEIETRFSTVRYLQIHETGQEPVAGSYKHGNRSWVRIKGDEFLDELRD
jgi:hypothetical protein